jgi:hypothetical protein
MVPFLKQAALVVFLVAAAAEGCAESAPKAECGKILAIEETTEAEAAKDYPVAFIVTSGNSCTKRLRVLIPAQTWLNQGVCDVGAFWPRCLTDLGEPGIRLPSTDSGG